MSKDDASGAFHEAGHCVTAYEFGWHLRHGGVSMEATRLRANEMFRTERADMIVHLAGWVSDAKFQRVPSLVAYDEIRHWLEICRGRVLRSRDAGPAWDPANVARTLLWEHPNISNRTAIATVRRMERETIKLLNKPRIWSAIERVAAALLQRRQLSHDRVVMLLGYEFFADTSSCVRLTSDDVLGAAEH